jgi:Kdo2-lipid IVA lauroyltransferase/acyltransferase
MSVRAATADDQRDAGLPVIALPAEPPRPTPADLFAGKAPRRRFVRFWMREYPRYLSALALYRVLGALPVPVTARIGGWLALAGLRLGLLSSADRAAKNVAALCPDLSRREIDAVVRRFYRGVGSVYAEASSTPRMGTDGSVTGRGVDTYLAARAGGPVILVGVHLGNWEAMGSWLAPIAGRLWALYDPPKSWTKRTLIITARRKSGIDLLPPTRTGTTAALRALRAGGTLCIFCDETGPDGRNRGPLFGRAPDPRSNLCVAVRLARLTGATLLPCHARRLGPGRYEAVIGDPVRMPPAEAGEHRLADDILALNAAIEPLVREHLDQWYMLDSRMGKLRVGARAGQTGTRRGDQDAAGQATEMTARRRRPAKVDR